MNSDRRFEIDSEGTSQTEDGGDLSTQGTRPDGPSTRPEDEVPTSSGTIFVSYRSDPDLPFAVAVKRLLESALEPPPSVFVAGDGGLRPSNIGYKPQIQQAASTASAFVALITPSFKDREWLFFEAGAAWGRKQLYAPILIDATTDDLSPSIADYQATKALDKAAMQRLLESVATAVGASLRPQFARRFSTFERALKVTQTPPEPTEHETPDNHDPNSEAFLRGMNLLFRGEHDSGERIFKDLEGRLPPEDPLRSEIRIVRAICPSDSTESDCLQALEDLDEKTRSSPAWHYWAGLYEPVPTLAIERLRKCLTSYHRELVLPTLTSLLMDTGEEKSAKDLAWSALSDRSRSLRASMAFHFGKLWPNSDPLLRLLLLSHGICSAPALDAIHEAQNLAIEMRWPAVAIHYGLLEERVKSGSSLGLGRALHVFGIPSGAYEAYKRAEAAGLMVARANRASLLSSVPVPAAALEALETHSGPFNSADPSFPDKVRSELRAAIHSESKRVEAIAVRGKRAVGLLASVAAEGLRERREAGPLSAHWLFRGSSTTLTPANTHLIYDVAGALHGRLRALRPDMPFWVLEAADPDMTRAGLLVPPNKAQAAATLFVEHAPGRLRGFSYDFSDPEALPVFASLETGSAAIGADS